MNYISNSLLLYPLLYYGTKITFSECWYPENVILSTIKRFSGLLYCTLSLNLSEQQIAETGIADGINISVTYYLPGHTLSGPRRSCLTQRQNIYYHRSECQPLWAPVNLLLICLSSNVEKRNMTWYAIFQREMTLALGAGDIASRKAAVLYSHIVYLSESYKLCEACVHFDTFCMSSSARKASLSNDNHFPCWQLYSPSLNAHSGVGGLSVKYITLLWLLMTCAMTWLTLSIKSHLSDKDTKWHRGLCHCWSCKSCNWYYCTGCNSDTLCTLDTASIQAMEWPVWDHCQYLSQKKITEWDITPLNIVLENSNLIWSVQNS